MVKRKWRGWELNGADSWLVCSSTLFGASQTTLTFNPALWIFSPRLARYTWWAGKKAHCVFNHWIHKLTRIYSLHLVISWKLLLYHWWPCNVFHMPRIDHVVDNWTHKLREIENWNAFTEIYIRKGIMSNEKAI